MSFYIRKSVNFGPLRFNLSKSGVGISAGVRGARVSTGPRGTYIHVGANGLYYRQRIGGGAGAKQGNYSDPSAPDVDEDSGAIHTADAASLVDSSNQEMLAQINSRINTTVFSPIIAVLATFVAAGVASLSFILPQILPTPSKVSYAILFLTPLFITAVLWAIGLSVAHTSYQQESLARLTRLNYKLDGVKQGKFAELQNALAGLAQSRRLWRIMSSIANWDWKRNAGATQFVNRMVISIGKVPAPYLATNVETYCISLGNSQLYFLPDQVFVFQNRQYGAVSYKGLQVQYSSTRFIEDGGVPADSMVLSYSWRYVRKDGGPDRRFANNRQLPVVQYGLIQLTTGTGLNVVLHVSNVALAEQFARVLLAYTYQANDQSSQRDTHGPRQGQARQHDAYEEQRNEKQKSERQDKTSDNQQSRERQRTASKSTSGDPYTVLEVSADASEEEITAAFRKMAQMYHPDKVAGLGPEIREVAERKMKEINAAYDILSRSFRQQ